MLEKNLLFIVQDYLSMSQYECRQNFNKVLKQLIYPKFIFKYPVTNLIIPGRGTFWREDYSAEQWNEVLLFTSLEM